LSDDLKQGKYIDNNEYAQFTCDPDAWSKPNEFKQKSLKLWDEATYQVGTILKDKRQGELRKHHPEFGAWNIKYDSRSRNQREKGEEQDSRWTGWRTIRGAECICESPAHNRGWSHVNAWNRARGDRSKARSNYGRRRKRQTGRAEEYHGRKTWY